MAATAPFPLFYPGRWASVILTAMDATDPKVRWYRPTPAWLVLGLLVVEGLLWLSERYQWFWFNAKKGWTVLIAVAVVGVAIAGHAAVVRRQSALPLAVPVLDSVAAGADRCRGRAVQLAGGGDEEGGGTSESRPSDNRNGRTRLLRLPVRRLRKSASRRYGGFFRLAVGPAGPRSFRGCCSSHCGRRRGAGAGRGTYTVSDISWSAPDKSPPALGSTLVLRGSNAYVGGEPAFPDNLFVAINSIEALKRRMDFPDAEWERLNKLEGRELYAVTGIFTEPGMKRVVLKGKLRPPLSGTSEYLGLLTLVVRGDHITIVYPGVTGAGIDRLWGL